MSQPIVRLPYLRLRTNKTMKLQELLETKRNKFIEIATKHGAYNVRVFGSVARGEETPASDMDGFT